MEPPKILPTSAANDTKYRMVNIAAKAVTFRQACAEGSIIVGPKVGALIASASMPKGDPLALAETAGILAAKKASDLIPLCHPLSLEEVEVKCALQADGSTVVVTCRVSTHAKTGVEMEALAGVHGALLTIYDVSKQIEKALTITNIRLLSKLGGKGGPWEHPGATGEHTPAPLAQATTPQLPSKGSMTDAAQPKQVLSGVRACVVTVSDRAAAGIYEDRSGPALCEALQAAGATIVARPISSDDLPSLTKLLQQVGDEAELVMTTGGTGLGPRDCTPEAFLALEGRLVPGIGELLRAAGSQATPFAWLSRSLAVTTATSLYIALPGSPKAVSEGMDVLTPILPHALAVLRGGHRGH